VEGGAGKTIADNLSWLGLQEVFARVCGILMVVLLARALAPSDYGSLSICLALMAMLTLLVRAGTGSRATRLTAGEAQLIPELHAEVTGLRIAVALVLVLVLVVFAVPLGAWLSVSPSLLIISSALLIRPALTVAWAFRGLDHMKPIALVLMGERSLVLAGVLLLMLGDRVDASGVIALEAVGGLAAVIVLRWHLNRLMGRRLDFRPHPSRWGEMLRESVPVSLAAIIASLYRHGDLLLLGILSGGGAAAMYLVPQKVVLTLLLLPLLVSKASFPSASRFIHSDLAGAVAVQGYLFRFTLLLLLPACAIAWFYSGEMLELFFGSAYLQGEATLKILLLSAPLFAYASFQENLLLAVPRPRTLLVCRIIASGMHIAISVLLIPRHGAAGAAFGCLVGQLLLVLLSATVWKAGYGGLPLQWRCLAPVVSSGFMLLFLDLAASWLAVWQSLIAVVLLYPACVFALRGISRHEISRGLQYLSQRMQLKQARL